MCSTSIHLNVNEINIDSMETLEKKTSHVSGRIQMNSLFYKSDMVLNHVKLHVHFHGHFSTRFNLLSCSKYCNVLLCNNLLPQ